MSQGDIRETFKHLRAYCDPRGHHVLDALEGLVLAQLAVHQDAEELLRALRDDLEPRSLSEAVKSRITEYRCADPEDAFAEMMRSAMRLEPPA